MPDDLESAYCEGCGIDLIPAEMFDGQHLCWVCRDEMAEQIPQAR